MYRPLGIANQSGSDCFIISLFQFLANDETFYAKKIIDYGPEFWSKAVDFYQEEQERLNRFSQYYPQPFQTVSVSSKRLRSSLLEASEAKPFSKPAQGPMQTTDKILEAQMQRLNRIQELINQAKSGTHITHGTGSGSTKEGKQNNGQQDPTEFLVRLLSCFPEGQTLAVCKSHCSEEQKATVAGEDPKIKCTVKDCKHAAAVLKNAEVLFKVREVKILEPKKQVLSVCKMHASDEQKSNVVGEESKKTCTIKACKDAAAVIIESKTIPSNEIARFSRVKTSPDNECIYLPSDATHSCIMLKITESEKSLDDLIGSNTLRMLSENQQFEFKALDPASQEKLLTYKVVGEITELYKPGPRLLVHLARFAFGVDGRATKSNVKIKIPLRYNFYKCFADVSRSVEAKFQYAYRLIGFLTHHGTSMSGGHYTCAVRKSGNKWFVCNDSAITDITLEDVETKVQDAYLLMYEQLAAGDEEDDFENLGEFAVDLLSDKEED